MIHFITFYLLVLGIVFIIKETNLFWLSKIRFFLVERSIFFYNLLECNFCLGFYCGSILYILMNIYYNNNLNIIPIMVAGITSGTVSYYVRNIQ